MYLFTLERNGFPFHTGKAVKLRVPKYQQLITFSKKGNDCYCWCGCVCVCEFHQGEEVVLQAESVHGLQAEVSDARQQTLQHGRAVLDAIEAHSAWVDL